MNQRPSRVAWPHFVPTDNGWQAVWFMLVCGICAITGCASDVVDVTPWVQRGDYDQSAQLIRQHGASDPSDETFMLDSLRLGILSMAQGDPYAAHSAFARVYDIIRRQGINRDRQLAAIVVNEDLKFWKGEPFEQALALTYYSMQLAWIGDWDNARAAAGNALFQLGAFDADDLGLPADALGQPIDAQAVAEAARQYERARLDPRPHRAPSDYPGPKRTPARDTGYALRESAFTLGYLMHGLASQQMGRSDEAKDYYRAAASTDRRITALTDQLVAGKYNTVLIIGYGLGPEKKGTGMDRVIERFDPRFTSDTQPIQVQIHGQPAGSFPVACDVNMLAKQYTWQHLKGLRLTKSYAGTILLAGGAAAAAEGARRKSDEAIWAGVIAMLTGVYLKASAHVDTRYCDVMPQRLYLVPLQLPDSRTTVHVQIADKPATRMALAGLSAPERGRIHFRYVNLVSYPDAHRPAPAWAANGDIRYANDLTGPTNGPQLPFILGGRCVRRPSPDALDTYQASGYLRALTVHELQQLYSVEDIVLDDEGQAGFAGPHILEGGRSLIPPQAGTAGFARLFGQDHEPYQPQSNTLKNFIRTQTDQLPSQ